MNQFEKHEKLVKTLDKEQKRQFRNLLFFLRTAMICAMNTLMEKEFKHFTDEHGYPDFYEIAMEICDEVLLSNESEYLKYMELFFNGDEKATDYFDVNFSTCTDWFFMDLAEQKLRTELQ